MPIIIIVLLALLVGMLGFWDTLGALLGAVAIIVLFWVALVALGVAALIWFLRRMTG